MYIFCRCLYCIYIYMTNLYILVCTCTYLYQILYDYIYNNQYLHIFIIHIIVHYNTLPVNICICTDINNVSDQIISNHRSKSESNLIHCLLLNTKCSVSLFRNKILPPTPREFFPLHLIMHGEVAIVPVKFAFAALPFTLGKLALR